MNNWNEFTTKIIKAVCDVPTVSDDEDIMKLTIITYLYKSLESEDIFEENLITLDQHDKEKKLNKIR